MTTPNNHQRHGHATAKDEGGEVLRSPTGYAVTEKMRWRTTPALYRLLDREFNFDIDVCSEDACALAPRWITIEEDALSCDWQRVFRTRVGDEILIEELDPQYASPVKTGFMNSPWAPPSTPEWVVKRDPDLTWTKFPGTAAFVRRAFQHSLKGMTMTCLIPNAVDAAWFKRLVKYADEVRFGPRFKFTNVHGEVGEQPPGGHLLLVYRPHVSKMGGYPGGPRVVWDWAYDLAEVEPEPAQDPTPSDTDQE